MIDGSGEQRRRVVRINRLEAFSDGVSAIAITLFLPDPGPTAAP